MRVIIKSLSLSGVGSYPKVRFNFNYMHHKRTNGKRLLKKSKHILLNSMPSVPPSGRRPIAVETTPYIPKSLRTIVAVQDHPSSLNKNLNLWPKPSGKKAQFR